MQPVGMLTAVRRRLGSGQRPSLLICLVFVSETMSENGDALTPDPAIAQAAARAAYLREAAAIILGGEETERRFRAVLDGLPAAIYTTDAAGRITYFNQA